MSGASSPSPATAGEGRGEGIARHRNSTVRARKMRKVPTEAEIKFWNHVRDRQLDSFKFKRQFPVGPFFADFVCLEAGLIVEIDGGQHNENPQDASRTAYLKKEGYEVVRFWNNDVLGNIEGVLSSLTLTLSRKRERELEAAHD